MDNIHIYTKVMSRYLRSVHSLLMVNFTISKPWQLNSHAFQMCKNLTNVKKENGTNYKNLRSFQSTFTLTLCIEEARLCDTWDGNSQNLVKDTSFKIFTNPLLCGDDLLVHGDFLLCFYVLHIWRCCTRAHCKRTVTCSKNLCATLSSFHPYSRGLSRRQIQTTFSPFFSFTTKRSRV